GGHLRVVRLHAGLFVALLVAGGGVAADRQRGAVLHQVVGHVADITATDRDRAVVELRVPEVGDVPVPEVEGAAVGVAVHVHGLVAVSDHRVRHVSVGLHPGELPGVDRRLDVTPGERSEEHTSELQSRENLVCRLLLEKKTCKQAGSRRAGSALPYLMATGSGMPSARGGRRDRGRGRGPGDTTRRPTPPGRTTGAVRER